MNHPTFSISKCVNPPSRSGWSTQVIYSQIFFFLFFCPTDDVTSNFAYFFFVSTNLKIWSVKSILKNFEENPWHTYFPSLFSPVHIELFHFSILVVAVVILGAVVVVDAVAMLMLLLLAWLLLSCWCICEYCCCGCYCFLCWCCYSCYWFVVAVVLLLFSQSEKPVNRVLVYSINLFDLRNNFSFSRCRWSWSSNYYCSLEWNKQLVFIALLHQWRQIS